MVCQTGSIRASSAWAPALSSAALEATPLAEPSIVLRPVATSAAVARFSSGDGDDVGVWDGGGVALFEAEQAPPASAVSPSAAASVRVERSTCFLLLSWSPAESVIYEADIR